MDFSGHLDDADLQLVRAGFTSTLWIPEFGWENEAEEAEMTPELPQLLAAIQIFLQLFVSCDVRVWAHLAAEMQAGKTGVVTTFIRLVLANAAKLRIRPNRIFVLTGMSDDAWKIQTRTRMPIQIRENVQHSKGLGKVALAFNRIMEKDGGETLSNVIVVLDESHIAAAEHNQPYKQIWATLQRLCPLEQWQQKNIRVVTISATDPAKVMAISAESRLPAAVVRLQTTDEYQSVETLVKKNRVRYTDDFGDLHKATAIGELKRCIEEDLEYGKPFYHILRPRMGKQAEVESLLRAAFPEASIRLWDAASKSSARSNATDDNTSGAEMNDINEILCDAPAVTTFILLKNMFYAAKTVDDSNVGIFYDRISGKDDTNLQSLLGRACGYGKSTATIVYTSKQTVENYLSCWRELCSNPSAPRLVNIPMSQLDKKMTGVVASTRSRGKSCTVGVSRSVATPLGQPDASVVAAAGGGSSREVANEDNFLSEWFEFNTLTEAKAVAKRSHTPRLENGFYLTSTTGKATVQRYDAILAIKGGKKTANMDWNKLTVDGDPAFRLYVGYKNINDPSSAVFMIRKLTRKA
jgi:hypothetical protein